MLCGAAAGIILLLVTGTGSDSVPDLIGLSYESAREKAASSDMAVEIDPMQDSSVDCYGMEVIEQDPKAGTQAEEGLVIVVKLEGLRESEKYVEDPNNPFDVVEENPADAGESDPSARNQSAEQPSPEADSGRIVCIDPGHSVNCPVSEIDPATGLDVADNGGASGELQAMWELAQRLAARLESMGYGVRLTKQSANEYSSLRTRADIGNTGSVVVRLHYDTNMHAILHPGEGQFKRNGSHVVHVDPGVARASADLASAMLPHLREVGITSVRNDCGGTSGNTGSAFVGSVLSRVPVVLIENDPAMVRNNPSGQERVATAIAEGVHAYLSNH